MVEEIIMNYWIFQAKIDRYDLQKPEILVEGDKVAWSVFQT
jgi:hypothetical protein